MRARECVRAPHVLRTRPLLSSKKTQGLKSCPTLQPREGEVKMRLRQPKVFAQPCQHGRRDALKGSEVEMNALALD
jgi:hypothetical protein